MDVTRSNRRHDTICFIRTSSFLLWSFDALNNPTVYNFGERKFVFKYCGLAA